MKNILLVLAVITLTIPYKATNIVNSESTPINFLHPLKPTIKNIQVPDPSQDMTDNEVIQTVFEGLFAENNLPGPFTIKYCFDDQLSH